jgi:hypothetical protein
VAGDILDEMKKTSIYIESDVDVALTRQAARAGGVRRAARSRAASRRPSGRLGLRRVVTWLAAAPNL